MDNDVLVALISSAPTLITAVVATLAAIIGWNNQRTSRRHNAQQTIIVWILHDRVNWYFCKTLPQHQTLINEKYEIYHKNGGNGTITREVQNYNQWVESIAKEVKK